MVNGAEIRRMRDAAQSLWTDVCSVTVRRPVQGENGAEELREEVILEGVKCRLSYITAGAAQLALGPEVAQRAKLTLDSGHAIPPGSMIAVERCGRVVKYRASGEPKLYSSHQEIEMELFERWA